MVQGMGGEGGEEALSQIKSGLTSSSPQLA